MTERITVVKIGGNVIDDAAALKRFLGEFAALPGAKILVHGGGKLATRLAERLELEVRMVEGRRITDKGMLDVVTMVYAGLVNKQIVAGLQAAGCNAIGLSGADGNIVTALSEALHTKEPSSDPDAEIPTPAAPVTQYGDLWILGRHRVLCGDCTRPEDRALLLDGNKPEILLTDPPYCSGGSKESQKSTGSIGTERKNGKAPKIANDILSTRGYQNLIRGALTDIPCLYAYIFTDWRMWVYLFDLVEAAGFGVKSEIVWDKGTPGMGVGWRSQHELILFGAKAATHFDGHKGYGNVLSISRSGNELHPTQKPVELLEKLVDNTDFATGVYDPFGGSGTTLAACEAYGQPSYIMELTPAFTDVIVKRYIRITGKTNVRCVRQGQELPREEIAAIFEPDEEGGEQE